MALIAHPRGGDGGNRGGWQQATREIKNLALAIFGAFALQYHGARLDQAGGIAKGGGAAHLGQQTGFLICVVIAVEYAAQQTV
jgi:hypothetical protein